MAWLKTHVRIVSGVKHEGGGLHCRMHMIIVLELCIREQLIPVVLLLASEDLEVLFQLLVDTLYLTV